MLVNFNQKWIELLLFVWYYHAMERYKIVIQYDGTAFSGFQVQPEKRTIQGEIEKVLEFLLGTKTKIYASGRTDAGVSALGQVAHFDTEKVLNEKSFEGSLNALLPDDIAITKLSHVGLDFDARFTVKKKTYKYQFYISKYTLPLFDKTAVRINDYADVELMKEACKFLIGTFDFSSFVAAKSGKTNFVRTIFDAKIVESENGVFAFEITGDGFLYNMVRIIFGTLVKVAYKKLEPKGVLDVILSKDRSKAGKTMAAKALILKNVEYEA